MNWSSAPGGELGGSSSYAVSENITSPIDWFALGDAWNHGTQTYSDRPHGDAYATATRIAKSLNLELPRP